MAVQTKYYSAIVTLFLFITGITTGCNQPQEKAASANKQSTKDTMQTPDIPITGYAQVNSLNMYYEIHGKGEPLVLLPGGGSTIYTTFGNVLPALAKSRQVIAIEPQGHGHTADIDRPLSFEQDADDVAALLQQLNIKKADIFGFSNGGNTALQIAIRHPQVVGKLVVASAFYKKSGLHPPLIDAFKQASHENMPEIYKEEYRKVAPNPDGLKTFVPKLMKRLLEFKDIPADSIGAIQCPALVISGNNDVATLEHTIEMYQLFPHGQLAVLPGAHGTYLGEILAAKPGSQLSAAAVTIITEFLDEQHP